MIASRLRNVALELVVLSARPARDWSHVATLVVVAPHPDDETLGCAAAIAKTLGEGGEVYVVVAADGAHAEAGGELGQSELRRVRSLELQAAMRSLGVRPENIRELGLPDGDVEGSSVELAQNIRDLVARSASPCRVLVTCWADPHPDHRAAAGAAHRATEGGTLAQLWEYPIWLWADWPISRRYGAGRELVRCLAIVLARRARKLSVTPGKAVALSEYRTQLGSDRKDGLPRELVARALSRPELYFPSPGPGSR